jgi:hypothetical protein
VTSGIDRHTIPGTGTFFVGIDVVPGRYRCENGKGGWWVRFTGKGGDLPVGMWPLPPGPAEVDIGPADFAFETRVPTSWQLISATPEGEAARQAARPSVDPTLRPELDRMVSRRRPLLRLTPMTALAACLVGFVALGSWGATMLIPLALVALFSRQMSEDAYRARALRMRRDRYVTPEDLDPEAQELLARAQRAVQTVLESQVHAEGLLDAADNALTLPQQEWETAQTLARQSRLRADQAEILAAGVEPQVEAALRPLRDKLDLAVQAVTRRIEALEHYAERALAADQAFRAHQQLEELSARAHEYDELLADAIRDELAVPPLQRLAEQGDALIATLRSRLVEAAEAYTELPDE